VEDEPFLGRIVKETLEGRGFNVLLINDGAHVIQNFKTFSPDICVLDVMLPNMDGFTVGKIYAIFRGTHRSFFSPLKPRQKI